eukprot:138649_1
MSEYGESQDYGSRLESTNRKCQDCFCALIYYLHIAGVVAAVCYIFTVYADEIREQIEASEQLDENSLDWTGVYVAIPVCAVSGLLFGLIWLQIIRLFAAFIIKLMLILNCIAWIVLFIIGCVQVNVAMIIICGLLALFWVLYTWCVWSRVAFSSVLLEISSKIAGYYKGTICVSITIVCMDILWMFLWGSMLFGYIILATEDNNTRVYGWIIFLMLISLYWGCSVNSNVGHTTYCAVAAVWYWSKNSSDISPSWSAFGRSMWSQFGSICLGSIIVALLEAIRTIINALMSDKCSCIKCCVMCCVTCIEWAIAYFNKYAYAHCAIYGTSFMKSAVNTWKLFEDRGIMPLINDDLTGSVLFCGSLLAAIVTAAVGYGIGWIFYQNDKNMDGVAAGLAVYGAVVGLILCICVLTVVKSGIVAIFTCFAEDPEAMNNNHPEEFATLVSSHPNFQNISDTVPSYDYGGSYGTASVPMKQKDNTSLNVKV